MMCLPEFTHCLDSLKSEKVRDIKFSKRYYVFSMPQNQEKKQIPRYEARFTNKNRPFMWLVCKTRAKILLSDPETSLTTPRLLPLRRSRQSYGNANRPVVRIVSKYFENDWGDRDDPDDHMETGLKADTV